MSIRDQLSIERKEQKEKGLVPDWISTDGYGFFKQKYLYEAESYKEQIERICRTAASYSNDPDYWEPRFFELFWKGWLSPSSPVLANTGTTRGLSVSCSGGLIDDSVHGFYSSQLETAILTKHGFGTSSYLGEIRGRGEKISIGGTASGVLPVYKMFLQTMRDIAQGTARRGAWAGYIEIDHKDFDELADYIKDNPDDANIGWNISDNFIKLLENGDTESIRRYQKALKLKMLTGKGYFFFPDKTNRASPKMYKDRNLKVKASNLCSEITLFSDIDHTFTCILSSMNLVYYDDWKNTDAVYNATVFLDCIASNFIEKASKIKGLESAVNFTKKGRALGLGVMGFHSYLQKNMIPFESFDSHLKNMEIFKHISDESLKASKWMAETFGEPEWCKGHGVRNTHRTAVAPTMSSSVLMGSASQGIEPFYGNCFIKDGASGSIEVINPQFYLLMKQRNKYSRKLVKEIADNHGSVQNLDWLTDQEKLVFRTAFEINQEVILRLAAVRQQYICQAQSINLFFTSDASEEYISKVHQIAFRDERIKSLYYIRTHSGVSASKGEPCLACT